MIRKEFLQIRRDKQSTMMLFVLPILQTMILGYAMTRDVRNISMGILDLDRSPASSSLSERLIQNDRFVNQGHFQSMEEMRQALLAGTIILGVVIPREFALQIEGATPDAVTM
jgi:ABC-2 type transport system permease protein